jgi:predicted acyltransferase (DUF342 family)
LSNPEHTAVFVIRKQSAKPPRDRRLTMKTQKPASSTASLLAAVALLTVVPMLAPSARASVPIVDDSVSVATSATVFSQSVYAGTYVTLSATSNVYGDSWAEAAVTVGANAIVDGNSRAGFATTLGALVHVNGNVTSGAATTLGAGSIVEGVVLSGAATTYGAASSVNNQCILYPQPPVQQEVAHAQQVLAGQFQTQYVLLPGNLAADTTLSSGVHGVAGPLSVSAGTTIELDASTGDEFIFNITGYATFGAGVVVKVINNPSGAPVHVYWNVTGTYISVGADAKIAGLLLANLYVSTGANSVVDGAYSATSYVTVGAGATVGSECEGGCATSCQ